MKLELSIALMMLVLSIAAFAQNVTAAPSSIPARVFISDSQSWSVSGSSGGSRGTYGGAMAGGARPQTAEIIKTFGERCPQVTVNNIQDKADYIVLLDHEGGKGVLRHRNKVAVFAHFSGDSVMSKSTLSLGGSVQEACDAISVDWAAHGPALRAEAAAQQHSMTKPQILSVVTAPATPTTGKMLVASTPDGADIEVDGGFVGNTPSEVQVAEGDHLVTVKKAGFSKWERRLRVSSGSNIKLNAELIKSTTP